MDRPQDYQRLGINPDHVEMWEDRRRSGDGPTEWEWWYSDFILDDGTKAVIQFTTADQKGMVERTATPVILVTLTEPDGTVHKTRKKYKAKDATYATDRCDVRIGPHRFAGDLHEYDIHVEESDGIAADLRLTSLGTAFRPGTAFFGFGDDDEQYYTWLCVVPSGTVTGSLTYGGKTHEVTGTGYHDHQWGTISHILGWNHWMWSRQGFEDYSILVFDMVANENYGFERFPLCFIEDKDGNLVFQNTHALTSFEVLDEYRDVAGGKDYPKRFRYVFEKDGTKVTYEVEATDQIEKIDLATQGDELMKEKLGTIGGALFGWIVMHKMEHEFEKYKLKPSYGRYGATGTLTFEEPGAAAVERSGHLIYEFMYPGAASYREHV
jgi:hypothetical protein